jgi:hypothetical protein
MKSLVSKIASLSLALLVLFSTLSFTVGIHYCGNIMMDKAVLAKAEPCEMHQKNPSEEESECCDDEVELIKGQDQLKIQSSDFELPLPIFVEAFVYTFFFNTTFETEVNTTIYEDPPPLLQRDFQTLYQVFLI